MVTATRSFDGNGDPIIDISSGLASITRSVNSIGGDTSVIFNGEYRIPIAGPLMLAPFFDVGLSMAADKSVLNTFGTTTTNTLIDSTNRVIRGSTGVEMSFMLPMVNAPFRLIFAYQSPDLSGHHHGRHDPVLRKGASPRHQVHDRPQLLIQFGGACEL